MINKTRQILMDSMIKQLGFENEWTIWFCQLCEDKKMTMEMISLAYAEAVKHGFEANEE